MLGSILSGRPWGLFRLIAFIAISWNGLEGASYLERGGARIENGNVIFPLYYYSNDGVTAAQFDFALPEGWVFTSVTPAQGLMASHEIDGSNIAGMSARVVVFSLSNATLGSGVLGEVTLTPPEGETELTDFSFVNAMLVDSDVTAYSLNDGFPSLEIIGHPQSVEITTGGTATLSVSVVGIDPVYAWYQGASGDESNPLGATSQSYTTAALSEDTSFWVKVTDAFENSENSNTASVTVVGSFVLTPETVSVNRFDGSASVDLTAEGGVSWTAESSEAWLTVLTDNGTGSSTIDFEFTANDTGAEREATITVGNAVATITQATRPVSFFDDYPTSTQDPMSVKQIGWFGNVYDYYYPWVYSMDHGWLYIAEGGEETGFFAYNTEDDFGWMYFNRTYYNETLYWLYSYQFETYLWFYKQGVLNNGRWFYDPVDGWFLYPEGDS